MNAEESKEHHGEDLEDAFLDDQSSYKHKGHDEDSNWLVKLHQVRYIIEALEKEDVHEADGHQTQCQGET